MNTAVSVSLFVSGLAFVLSMLVAVMIKIIYWTVNRFSAGKENKS